MADPSDGSSHDPTRPGIALGRSGVQADLAAALSDRMMARADAGAAIVRDLDARTGVQLPSLGEIERAVSASSSAADDQLRDIEALLSLDKVGNLLDEGSRLNQLLDRGAASVEEQSMLRHGLIFLRRGMFREAEEWWNLNLPPASTSAFALLLKMLLVLTLRLAGHEARAAAIHGELKSELRRHLR